MIGRMIGSYEIQSLLGAGGMGEVYRARDAKLGRDVAIKVHLRGRPTTGVAWHPSGRQLAAFGNPGTSASFVSVLEPGSGQPPRELFRFPVDVRLRGMTWSRDGSSLIVGQQGRTSDIVLFEASRP